MIHHIYKEKYFEIKRDYKEIKYVDKTNICIEIVYCKDHLFVCKEFAVLTVNNTEFNSANSTFSKL